MFALSSAHLPNLDVQPVVAENVTDDGGVESIDQSFSLLELDEGGT